MLLSCRFATRPAILFRLLPMTRPIRNIAIIAHVDHGKTTLVDKLLQQSGTFAAHEQMAERVMDSNDLERERGITILAKNCAVELRRHPHQHRRHAGPRRFRRRGRARAVDGRRRAAAGRCGRGPDAADALRHAQGAGAGPEAHRRGQQDRPPRRAARTGSSNQTFDLFDKLGATDEQLDFPVIYASALHGWASTRPPGAPGRDMSPLFEAILKHVPAPQTTIRTARCSCRSRSLDYSSYVGRIGIGRIRRGTHRAGAGRGRACYGAGRQARVKAKIDQVLTFKGLERVQRRGGRAPATSSLVTGIEDVDIGIDRLRPDSAGGAAACCRWTSRRWP